MSFFELLDGLLSELYVPYFEGQPEFSGDAPDKFITYSVYDVPKLHGCGREIITAYFLTVNIYTTGPGKAREADSIGGDLTALLTDNGFVRRGGSFGLTDDFPGCYHRILEFEYCRRN